MESSVHGTASLDGQPLPRGNVAFHPVKSGAIAYGSISADGSYELKTGGTQGLVPGEYRVIVISTEPAQPAPENRAPTPGKLITPEHYGSVGTTPLLEEIKPGSNRIDLKLVSATEP